MATLFPSTADAPRVEPIGLGGGVVALVLLAAIGTAAALFVLTESVPLALGFAGGAVALALAALVFRTASARPEPNAQ